MLIYNVLFIVCKGKEKWHTKEKEISIEAIRRQEDICREIYDSFVSQKNRPLAMVDTYGCQQNEADSEKLRGYLAEMGYGFTEDEIEADVIVVNTCAVREHAEMRVLGNVGQQPQQKAAPGADNRRVRLHGAAGAHGREDKEVLPRGRSRFRAARAVALPGAAAENHDEPQARFRRREKATARSPRACP